MSARRTSLPPALVGLTLLAIAGIVAGCSGPAAATAVPQATTASSPAPTASAAASPSAAPIASPTSGPATSALSGRWSVAALNPRVVVATGSAAGGTVTVDGNRFNFIKGSLTASGPIDFVGQFDLACTAKFCRIPGTIYEIRAVDGDLVVVNSGFLTPYGSTELVCGQPPFPGGGVVTVVSQVPVQSVQVPGVIQLTGGESGGIGGNCSQAGWQLGWDLVGTRQP